MREDGSALAATCPTTPWKSDTLKPNRMGKSITNKTSEAAGKSMEKSPDESRKNALDLLKKVRGEKPAKIVKDPSGYDRYDDP